MGNRSAAETVGQIFWAFLETPTWAQADLARRVGVSSRALRLRLEELERGGMPLEWDEEPPNVMWSVPKGWFPDGVALGKDEVAQVVRFIARLPRSPSRDAVMRKLLRASASATIAANEMPLAEHESILAMLEDARAARRTVRIVYTTGKTGVDSLRHVSVQHIEYGAKMRFIGFCHKARELRWFRVSRVRDAQLDNAEAFVAAEPGEVEALLARSVDGWTDDVAPREVSFVVYGEDARWVPGNLPSPRMTVETCNGGVRVTAVTSAITVIARFVVGLGGAAVVETPELARRVEELLQGAMARRRGSGGMRGEGESGGSEEGSGAPSASASGSGPGSGPAGVVKAWNGRRGQAAKASRVR